MAYESSHGQTRRDGGDGARADVARYPAAGGQEGEEEGVRGRVVLGFGFGLVCLLVSLGGGGEGGVLEELGWGGEIVGKGRGGRGRGGKGAYHFHLIVIVIELSLS